MTTENKLPLPNPDFDELKNSLKLFMESYPGLQDYNFDGSTLSIILDTLSYNSHLNAFWLNMIGNEAFLNTAVKRNNVVSAARDLGYTPISARSAYTDVYMELTPAPDAQLENFVIVETGTAFAAKGEISSYTFNMLDDVIAYYDPEVGKYIVEDARIHEGRVMLHTWDVAAAERLGYPDEVYDLVNAGVSIPNLSVDTSTMRVMVQEYISNTDGTESRGDWRVYDQYDFGLNINKSSRVYFLSEDDTGRVNITFGDGNLGYKPAPGSKIKIMYVISSGPGANGVSVFSPATPISGISNIKVWPRFPASGGSFTEDVDSIKFNAQRAYESQGSAVVGSDYEHLVKTVYPNAKKVIAWGGHEVNPPQYGKVFISVQPEDGVILTEKDKETISKFIKDRNIITIESEITAPDYVDIDLDISLIYDKLQNSTGQIQSEVINTLKKYEAEKLQTFDKDLDYSRLVSIIDNASPYIKSNNTKITISKRLTVNVDLKREYTLDFGNAIKPETLTSSMFAYSSFNNCYFKYYNGKLAIFSYDEEAPKLILSDAGTLDPNTGIVTVAGINIKPNETYFNEYLNTNYIKVTAEPATMNVYTSMNQILTFDNITINHIINDGRRY